MASKYDKYWRELIGNLRQVYNGKLTSSANWGWLNATGGEETNKTWWNAVDYIGIDAYYNITDLPDPTVEQLMAAW